MPSLTTRLHLDMLDDFKRQRGLLARLKRVLKRESRFDLYGLDWGDPEAVEPLRYMRQHYIDPYVNPEHTAVELGPGGGRWTRYLLGFKEIYAIDYHQELLDELKRNYAHYSHIHFIKNSGNDFPGVAAKSVDFVFSFGVFVHLDLDIIKAYLANMRAILKPRANVVLQYSDSNKILARMNKGFSENDPEKMRSAVKEAGYTILEEDLTSLWHSAVIRVTN